MLEVDKDQNMLTRHDSTTEIEIKDDGDTCISKSSCFDCNIM